VGYRAQMKGQVLSIAVGYSHPVEMPVPEGLKVETPTQTQVVVRGADRQRVGQLAANIRAVRPPEPYKGKGIRYSDEIVARKEAKKKK
jgi:large subunit ribosomal protein L6